MAQHMAVATNEGRWAKVGAFLLHEFNQVWPPTLFFFIGFNLIAFTTRLILAQYLIHLTGFFLATTAALVVGKVVLVVDKMPFLRRFDNAPLIRPILFKTVVYTFFVMVARSLETFIHYLIEGGDVGLAAYLDSHFSWHRFAAIQIWIFVLFLVYVTASELSTLIGDGELYKVFFTRRSTELKSTRRARIRQLVRLARLTDAHSIDELADPRTVPHAQLVEILRELAGPSKNMKEASR